MAFTKDECYELLQEACESFYRTRRLVSQVEAKIAQAADRTNWMLDVRDKFSFEYYDAVEVMFHGLIGAKERCQARTVGEILDELEERNG